MTGLLHNNVVRYILVGIITTTLTWACVLLFVEIFKFHYLLSTNLATFSAYGISYLLNKLFVFEDHKGGHIVKGTKFIALQLSLLVFANAMMFSSVSIFKFHYMPSVVVVTIIAAAINYSVMKLAIFNINARLPGKELP